MKLNLPIAAKNGQKMALSNTHVGTLDFFRPFVNYYLESVPKDKLNAKIRQFVQAYPLAGANLGQFRHSMYGFHVPYRVVWNQFNDWITHSETEYYTMTPDNGSLGYKGDYLNGLREVIGYRPFAPLLSRMDLTFLVTGLNPYVNMTGYGDDTFLVPSPQEEGGQLYTSQDLPYTELLDSLEDINAGRRPIISNMSIKGSKMLEYMYVCRTSYFTDDSFLATSKLFDEAGGITCYYTRTGTGGSTSYYIFVKYTNYGRYFRQLIESIGYVFSLGGYFTFYDSTSEPTGNNNMIEANYRLERDALERGDLNAKLDYSALPLLSLYKVFVDYFVPTKFRTRYDVQLRKLAKYQYPFRPIAGATGAQGNLATPVTAFSPVYEIFLYTCYPDDYFTNAFLYPNGSNSGESSDIEIQDITSNNYSTDFEFEPGQNIITQTGYGSYNQEAMGTPNIQNGGVKYNGQDSVISVSPLTSYSLRALNALNNFIRRNQIVGYKTIDRYLARWGVKLDNTQANRSVLINSDTKDIVPLNVMSQADSTDSSSITPQSQQALLGGRASNILFGHDFTVKYDSTDEFGMFLIISTLTPKIGYVDGLDRTILHIKYDDFYQPEFDSLGVQPIIKGELFNRFHRGADRGKEIFGFAPRYSEYKIKLDKLSGDFVFPSRNSFIDSLHTFRRFGTEPDSINNEFLIGNNSEYDRIFVFDSDDYDHFQSASYNDVTVIRHTDSYSDVKDITDGHSDIRTSVGGNNTLH